MTTTLHELEAQILGLGDAERARLLERLIDSFEPDSGVERAWVTEALRREADVKAGSAIMVPADQAVQRARERLA